MLEGSAVRLGFDFVGRERSASFGPSLAKFRIQVSHGVLLYDSGFQVQDVIEALFIPTSYSVPGLERAIVFVCF